jgi:hypothetical protein
MARFVGKETDVGSELLGRILTFILVVVVLLIILMAWHPLWARDFLTVLGLWDLATTGFGR